MEERTKKSLIGISWSIFILMILISFGGFIWGENIEIIYFFAALIIPIFLAIVVGILYYSSSKFKEILAGDSIFIKLFSLLGGLLLIVLTAVISFLIFSFFALWTGTVDPRS